MYKDMAINQKHSVSFPMGNQTSKLVLLVLSQKEVNQLDSFDLHTQQSPTWS